MTAEQHTRVPAEVTAPARRRRVPGRSRSARAPAARVVPGAVAEPRHRNPTWLLAGLLLIVMSALGGVLLFTSQDDRTDVLVAAGDLEAGDVVGRGDLRIARVTLDRGLAVVRPDDVDAVVGQRVVARVPGGTLVNRAMFASGSGIAADEMEIGTALDPGEFPRSDIPRGARVELLVATALPAGPSPSVPMSRVAGSIGVGTVTAIEERASGQLLVTVRVDKDVGYEAAAAASADTLRLVLIADGP